MQLICAVAQHLNSFYVIAQHLDAFFDQKWGEESTLMNASRQRFQSLADETAVIQLIFKTINLRKRKAEGENPLGGAPPETKRLRMSRSN